MTFPFVYVAENFSEKEVAWSAIYDAPCLVLKRENDEKYIPRYGVPVYAIYVKQESELYPGMAGFYGHSAAYDLGKLEHLKSYGVNTERL